MIEKIPSYFRIIKKIGEGGMALIYLVLNRRNGEKYAIKILNSHKKDSHADKKRFEQEIKLTKKVNSDKVIKVYAHKWNEDIQYILMEYVEGKTLSEYLKSKKRLSLEEVIDISMQIAEGFMAIHKINIVHRDIKPSNIIITGSGNIKIIDFGIAITNDSERLTREDSIIASPHYLAPELVEREKPSVLSDIYSLGILMFEMITGNTPYKDNSPALIIQMHKNNDVPHVNKIFKNIPQSLTNVIIKATARNKSLRHKNMEELYEDLSTSLDSSRAFEKEFLLVDKKRRTFIEIVNSKIFILLLFLFFTISLITIIILLLFMENIW